MNTCKHCLHWQKDEAGFMGTCSCEKFVEQGTGRVERDGMEYWDYEGYSAGFNTGKDFGCIHWKQKTKKKNQSS